MHVPLSSRLFLSLSLPLSSSLFVSLLPRPPLPSSPPLSISLCFSRASLLNTHRQSYRHRLFMHHPIMCAARDTVFRQGGVDAASSHALRRRSYPIDYEPGSPSTGSPGGGGSWAGATLRKYMLAASPHRQGAYAAIVAGAPTSPRQRLHSASYWAKRVASRGTGGGGGGMGVMGGMGGHGGGGRMFATDRTMRAGDLSGSMMDRSGANFWNNSASVVSPLPGKRTGGRVGLAT